MKKLIIPILSILTLTNCPQKGGGDPSAFAFLGLTSPATDEPALPTPTIRLFVGETDPVAVLDGATFDTGSTPATTEGVAHTVTILNNGQAVLNLSSEPVVVLTGSGSDQFEIDQPVDRFIDPGDTIQFTLKFTPTSTGGKGAQLQIASNDPNTPTYRLNLTGTGTAAPEPEIEIWQASNLMDGPYKTASFPSTQELTSSSPLTFTVHNKGSASLNIAAIELVGDDPGDFSLDLSSTSYSIDPGETTTFSLSFMPQANGYKNATVRIQNNDSNESTYTFKASGYASPTPAPKCEIRKAVDNSVILPDGTYDFGNQVIQTVGNAAQFKIVNNGNAALNLTGVDPDYVVLSGADADQFEITVQPASTTVAPWASTTFSVRFRPASLGTKTATLSIANNDADRTPYVIHLQGQGVPVPAPKFKLKHGTTYIESGVPFTGFPAVRENGQLRLDFSVENAGTATLEVEDILWKTGPDASRFTVFEDYTMGDIAPGATGEFRVYFSPTSSGTKTVRIRIDSNDSTVSPFYFDIEATAYTPQNPCMDITGGTLSSNAYTDYISGIGTVYFSHTIPIMTDAQFPSVVYYVEQPHAIANPAVALFSTYWDGPTPGTSTKVWYSKDGVGLTSLTGMMPYGTDSKQYFTTLMQYPWQIGSYSTAGAFVGYIDIGSAVSFAATNASYQLIRGCHARLTEEIIAPHLTEGTTSDHGLNRNWTNRKKMKVNLIFVEGTYDDPTVAGIQDAVNRMKDIFAQNSVKIDLSFAARTISAAEYQTIANLSDDTGTITGSLTRLYQTSGAAQDPEALNIYFTSDNSEVPGVLGISSGIPGVPGIPGNKRGAMAVFIEMHRSSGAAGSSLSAADLQFMGDTMAHEAGHFLGLFHTNERSGYNPDSPVGLNARDALVETPYCLMSNDSNGDGYVDLSECQGSSFTNSGAYNLMFWVGDGVLSQTQLTGEQGWVLRNHPLAY